MTETQLQYVKVHTLSDRFEADVITDALRQEGIPVLVRSFVETPYAGLFIPQRGWGRIMVPKEMAGLAREIISGLAEVEFDGSSGETESRIEPELWDDLRQAESEEVAARALVEFDQDENVYVVPFFNTAALIHPESDEVEVLGRLEDLSGDFQLGLVMLHYLLRARGEHLSNRWVSEKDLPGGGAFFTASHKLPMGSLAGAFDGRPGLLGAAAENIGGERWESPGISYRFRILPRIPLLTVFWDRDEEFEPSFHVLFDETIVLHLSSLDLVWGLVNIFTRVLLDSASSARAAGIGT